MTENLKTNQLFVSMDLSSKQFPATDAVIKDRAGTTLLLGGAAAYGTALNLMGADNLPIKVLDVIIGIKEGTFQNVTMGGKSYSVEQFNKLGESRPAGPFDRIEKDKEK